MGKEKERGGKTVHRVLIQDLYRTGLHAEEVGIRQMEQWRAKSRQFTTDSDIIGRISEAKRTDEGLPHPEKRGFVVIRQSMWDDASDALLKRLVIKLFSDSGRWLATAEEMVAEELAHSYASESPLISLAIMTAENELVTYVRQLRRGVGATEAYGLFIPGPSGSFEVFRIEGKRATLGDDFRVLLLSGRDAEVAEIDSKFADVGGEFQVRIKDKILADNELFCRVLQCFSVVTRYREEMRAKTLGLLERWRRGEIVPKQHRYEVSLMGNPRRLTLDTNELEEV